MGVSESHNHWSTLFVPISMLYTLAARYVVIMQIIQEYIHAINLNIML